MGLFQATLPIPGSPSIVSDGQNSDVGRSFKVDDVVWETRYTAASNWQVGRHARDDSASLWHRHDLINSCINRVEEFNPKVLSPILVPLAGETVFRVSLFLETDVRIHRRRSSASARRRTS